MGCDLRCDKSLVSYEGQSSPKVKKGTSGGKGNAPPRVRFTNYNSFVFAMILVSMFI